MAHYMPPPMLALFTPRPPLEYKPPMDVYRKRPLPYTGLAAFKDSFKPADELKPLEVHETAKEKKERRKKRKLARGERQAHLHAKLWNPQQDDNATKDPYKTLFLGRLPYSLTEEALRREVERCGRVKQLRLVRDVKSDKPRGYAFVEFEDAADFKYAYRALDGIKMEKRRIIADVERGRTVPDWKPRKLGGGLGATRTGEKKTKEQLRQQQQQQQQLRDVRNGGGGGRFRGGGGGGGGGDGYRAGDRRRRDDYRGDDRRRDDYRREEYRRREERRRPDDRRRVDDRRDDRRYGGGGGGGGDRPRYRDSSRYEERPRRSAADAGRRRSYDERGRDPDSRRY